MKQKFSREGHIIDVTGKKIIKGVVDIEDGKILSITEKPTESTDYIMPGLIDAHIHIESSMLIPSEFARLAVVHGTVATVSDPHEIANVLGLAGVDYMIKNSETVPFKFYFGAPSCVPATSFESSGASIGPDQIEKLLRSDKIKYLSEMMNFPGVLYDEPDVVAKLAAAKKVNKPVDGHAPGLRGNEAKKYIERGISTDHECFTLEEALEKIKYGMKIQIREGSAARNFDTLIPLLKDHAENIMFCSDDRHPDDLIAGHMNGLVKKAIALGYDPLEVIRVCTFNPVEHYRLNAGLLREGDAADFIVVDDLKQFTIKETYIDGELVASEGKSLIRTFPGEVPNIFNATPIQKSDIRVIHKNSEIKVIKAIEGQLVTTMEMHEPKVENNEIVSDTDRDILKILVLNRYEASRPAIGFIRGFGLHRGAIASTVAHDSHNIIAVGSNDDDLVSAVNELIRIKGGITLVNGKEKHQLPLPVAGIMSTLDGKEVALQYEQINKEAKRLGTKLHSPLMTLSFMALLVIPELKLSDKGLFDGNKFSFTSLYADEKLQK